LEGLGENCGRALGAFTGSAGKRADKLHSGQDPNSPPDEKDRGIWQMPGRVRIEKSEGHRGDPVVGRE